MLKITNLYVTFDNKTLLENINLNIADKTCHLLIGHNGSGKSTLAQTIIGNPEYKIEHGKIIFDNIDITNKDVTSRALLGIFLGAQNVPEIPGLTVLSLLKHSLNAHEHFQTGHNLSMAEFLEKINNSCQILNIPQEWLNRSVNVGFSGGEKKKIMLLRLMMTKPKFAILDEPDSGSDLQTQNLIANTIHNMPTTTFLIISHQKNFIDMVSPTNITTLKNGTIIKEN